MKIIYTNKGQGIIVDDDDYEWLNQYTWFINNSGDGYACRARRLQDDQSLPQIIQMHRIVNSTPKGMFTDHINGNTLDNRKSNLRTCTPKENTRNSRKPNLKIPTMSQYKGIVQTENGKWEVHIGYEDKRLHFGTFSDEKCAANAYNHYAKMLFGEFARLNDVEYIKNWMENQFVPVSIFYGVGWDKQKNKWRSRVVFEKREIFLGYFESEVDAAKAYNKEASHLYGVDYIKVKKNIERMAMYQNGEYTKR